MKNYYNWVDYRMGMRHWGFSLLPAPFCNQFKYSRGSLWATYLLYLYNIDSKDVESFIFRRFSICPGVETMSASQTNRNKRRKVWRPVAHVLCRPRLQRRGWRADWLVHGRDQATIVHVRGQEQDRCSFALESGVLMISSWHCVLWHPSHFLLYIYRLTLAPPPPWRSLTAW